MIWLELALLLACIVVGSRLGGISLGTVSALGLLIMVFAFGLPPAGPPVVVLGMIIAVVTAAATMQAAGGLDYLVTVAERVLRAQPKAVTIVAPVVTYTFTLFAGTAHIVYALLPVIAEVSRKAGVRPERPLTASVIGAHLAITASPITAATVALLGFLAPKGITLQQILMVCIPSTLLGTILAAISVWKMGPELADDPIYQQRLKDGKVQPPPETRKLEGSELTRARGSVLLFISAALAVVAFGLFPSLRPQFPAGETDELTRLGMPAAIGLVMLSVAALNSLFFGAKPDKAVTGSIAKAGVVAVISILGIGWLATCFFEGNKDVIIGAISDAVKAYPLLFAAALFVLSALMFSQAATTVSLMPVGLALGLSPATLIALFPAVNGDFFLPTYGTIVAAISFDQTGTTRVGKYVLNHSFMRAGFVGVGGSVLIGLAISKMVL